MTEKLTYKDTFISVADDTRAQKGMKPEARGQKQTIPEIEYKLLKDHPYTLTQEELTFRTHLIRQGIAHDKLAEDERNEAWNALFTKGQPCLRASSLTKNKGWGAHFNNEGKVAIYAMESAKYRQLNQNKSLKQLKAMRSSRK